MKPSLALALWRILEQEKLDKTTKTLSEVMISGYPMLALGQIYEAKYDRVPEKLWELIRLVQHLKAIP